MYIYTHTTKTLAHCFWSCVKICFPVDFHTRSHLKVIKSLQILKEKEFN